MTAIDTAIFSRDTRSRNANPPDDLGERVKSSVSAPPSPHGTALLESSDDYHSVVIVLDARTRVIATDQWVIQERKRSGRNAWESKYFFRSKEGLLSYAPKPTAFELLALPDWFPDQTTPHLTKGKNPTNGQA